MQGKLQILQSAQQVCNDIESFHVNNTAALLSSLIKLLEQADKLARTSIHFSDEDLSYEAEVPSSLTLIPENVAFHVLFDPLDPSSVCASSLRESLGEIFEALKPGLDAIKAGKSLDAVLWQWKLEYETHWGRHVLDVIRFLFLCPREDA
jgi:hypothetical protein